MIIPGKSIDVKQAEEDLTCIGVTHATSILSMVDVLRSRRSRTYFREAMIFLRALVPVLYFVFRDWNAWNVKLKAP